MVEHLKVEQCFGANPAGLADVAHAGNANHDGAEDNGCQQHLDEFDKGITQWLHLCADRGPEVTDGNADTDAKQHLYVQLAVQRCLDCGV